MTLHRLPLELIHDIVSRLLPRDNDWINQQRETAWFLSLRRVSHGFDTAVINRFLSDLTTNPRFNTKIPLLRSLPTPSMRGMCARLLTEQLRRCSTSTNNNNNNNNNWRGGGFDLINAIMQTIATIMDTLRTEYLDPDLPDLQRTYTAATINAVIVFAHTYRPLMRLAARTKTNTGEQDREEFNPADRYHLALVVASYLGRVEDMQCFVAKGADVHFNDKYRGWLGCPLHAAAAGGQLDAIRFLVDRGVDVGLRDAKYARTALHYATGGGQEETVRYLLGCGVEVGPVDASGDTPLAWAAAAAGSGPVVRLLLDHGADGNRKGVEGKPPLTVAVQGGHVGVVAALLEREEVRCDDWADLRGGGGGGGDSGPQSLLTLAALAGNESVFHRLLADSRVNRDMKHPANRLIVCRGVVGGCEAIVRTAVALPGVDINAGVDSHTPLMLAMSFGEDGMVRMLLAQAGIDVHAANEDGETALHLGVQGGSRLLDRSAAVRALLEREDLLARPVDPRAGYWYVSGLGIMAGLGYLEQTHRFLANPEVDVNAPGAYRQTPLGAAAAWNHPAIVRLLLMRDDVDVNSMDEGGFTPLMNAAAEPHEEVLRMLLEDPRTQVRLRNEFEETALDLAALSGRLSAVRLLLEPNRGFSEKGIELAIMRADGYAAVQQYLEEQLRRGNFPSSVGGDTGSDTELYEVLLR